MSGMLFWLSSYMKSGNTWMRMLISNVGHDGEKPAEINDLKTMIGSTRSLFDSHLGFWTSDLTADETDLLRPEVYRHLGLGCKSRMFMKTHDAYTFLPDGRPLFPREGCCGVIYIARNPLDVAVSLSHHMGWELDRTIKNMGDPGFLLSFDPKSLKQQLRQKILSWSGHVNSWLDQKSIPVHLVKYEDLQKDAVKVFAGALNFSGIDVDEMTVRKAVAFSGFDILQKQESKAGFKEKPPTAGFFFREGKVGAWRNVLNEKQVHKIISDHREAMMRLEYLDEIGNIS
ncbi:MAG: sulfotransferase domain-containing protein [Desulfobacteraceae bacterium]|jgi:hypothetical protein